MERRDGLKPEIRPHSIVLLRFHVWCSGNISVFLPASVIYFSLYLSTLKTFKLWNPFMKHILPLLFPLERVDVCGAPLVCSGSGNFTDDAKRTECAQTDRERQHIHDIVSWQNLCKAGKEKLDPCLSDEDMGYKILARKKQKVQNDGETMQSAWNATKTD